MIHQDKIYNQSGVNVRNSTAPVVKTSSDICTFNMPFFTMTNASKINCGSLSGLTSGDTNVHIVTGDTNVSLDFTFTANTEAFDVNDSDFRFEIYKYDNLNQRFISNPVYKSDTYEWSSFSGTSALTENIPTEELKIDGDYLVKGYYNYNACVEFDLLEGNTYDTINNYIPPGPYRIYQEDRDYHFIVFTEAETPELVTGVANDNVIGGLTVSSVEMDGTTNLVSLPSPKGDFVITYNGLVLAKGLDYEINPPTTGTSANVLTLYETPISGDLLTFTYVNKGDNSLKIETMDIDNPIVSGVTDNQGDEVVYYNTTANKYELYVELTPVSGNNVVITLNGALLANNIDYYQSISNSKRFILEGELLEGDIVNVFYSPTYNTFGDVFGTSLTAAWVISVLPETNNGSFTVEVSTDKTFTTINDTYNTPYVTNQLTYSQEINLIGGLGSKLYYRIKNDKNYKDLCDNVITTTNYSEVSELTIQTNTINSY